MSGTRIHRNGKHANPCQPNENPFGPLPSLDENTHGSSCHMVLILCSSPALLHSRFRFFLAHTVGIS